MYIKTWVYIYLHIIYASIMEHTTIGGNMFSTTRGLEDVGGICNCFFLEGLGDFTSTNE